MTFLKTAQLTNGSQLADTCAALAKAQKDLTRFEDVLSAQHAQVAFAFVERFFLCTGTQRDSGRVRKREIRRYKMNRWEFQMHDILISNKEELMVHLKAAQVTNANQLAEMNTEMAHAREELIRFGEVLSQQKAELLEKLNKATDQHKDYLVHAITKFSKDAAVAEKNSLTQQIVKLKERIVSEIEPAYKSMLERELALLSETLANNLSNVVSGAASKGCIERLIFFLLMVEEVICMTSCMMTGYGCPSPEWQYINSSDSCFRIAEANKTEKSFNGARER
jgi:hypothetical protein